ncbi:MAG: hypothetical protein II411_03965, partial [Lachnospiraceae bacterium]|nr:hypothetical protein [Lachnospiraceae bacterium]
MKALIKNGLVIDPSNSIKDKLDILIENDKVSEIKKGISCDVNYEIDAKGYIVSPGFVDLHPNFCDPGATDREDLKSGSLSAAKGGITHVVLGVDNKPAPSESNVIDYINKYSKIMPINIYPSAAVTEDRQGLNIADISFLYNHGAIGFYDGLKPIEDKNLLEKIMVALKDRNKVFSIYSESNDGIKLRGVIEGSVSKKLNLKGAIPQDAEALDLKENIALAKYLNCKLDLAYVTSSESVSIVEEAKNQKVDLYAETPALNLYFNDKALEKFGTLAKVLPPLRPEADRVELCKG